jgi:hypothetical protein
VPTGEELRGVESVFRCQRKIVPGKMVAARNRGMLASALPATDEAQRGSSTADLPGCHPPADPAHGEKQDRHGIVRRRILD